MQAAREAPVRRGTTNYRFTGATDCAYCPLVYPRIESAGLLLAK